MSTSGFRQPPDSGPNSWPPSAFAPPVVRRRRRRVLPVVDPVNPLPLRRRRRGAVPIVDPVVAAALPIYFDGGDPSYVCSHCGAFFWSAERLTSSPHDDPLYSQCCKSGGVVLPAARLPPPNLLELFQDSHFRHNIRAYNSMFSMTSFGAKIDESVASGHGPYTFKISGQVFHWIGSLCPQAADRPRFLQLYLYDTQNEVQNRLHHFSGEDGDGLKAEVVSMLSSFLVSHNGYVRTFRNAVRIANDHRVERYSVRLYNNMLDVRYALPQETVFGAIVVAGDPHASRYDIIVSSLDGRPHRISKLHPSYMPLQYPLLFAYGEVGLRPQLRLRREDGTLG